MYTRRCLSCAILLKILTRLPRNTPRILLLPLHAGLSTDEQLRIFEPAERGTRKVIISTNIAEASVTIDGIKYVVDCGFVKVWIIRDCASLSPHVSINRYGHITLQLPYPHWPLCPPPARLPPSAPGEPEELHPGFAIASIHYLHSTPSPVQHPPRLPAQT